MKLVINGYAGAGTITMGGYDYHGQGRATGELARPARGPLHGRLPRVRRAPRRAAHALRVQRRLALCGRRRRQQRRRPRQVRLVERQPADRRLVLPGLQPGQAAPQLFTGDSRPPEQHQQIGWFRNDGSVETAGTPAANNVNLLVETVILNYMALHGEQGQFGTRFPGNGLGSASLQDSLIAFNPIVNGTIV